MNVYVVILHLTEHDINIKTEKNLLYFIDNIKRKFYNSFVYGLVAQLGECYIRIVEVVGSTPIESTKQRLL